MYITNIVVIINTNDSAPQAYRTLLAQLDMAGVLLDMTKGENAVEVLSVNVSKSHKWRVNLEVNTMPMAQKDFNKLGAIMGESATIMAC